MNITKNPHNPSTNPPGWLWLFAGAMLGLFIAFLVFLSRIPLEAPFEANQGSLNKMSPNMQQSLAQATGTQATSTQVTKATSSPKFTFYTQLPRAELFPSFSPQTKPQQKENDIPAPTSANPTESKFIVQSGAFKDPKQAERQKVDLILMGLSPIVQAVTTTQGQTWHRVTFGPFNNIEKANAVESRLKELKLNPTTYRR